MAIIVSYETGGDSYDAIGDDGGVEYDVAQSFTMGGTDSLVDRVAIYCRKLNTISDAITVRLETNSGSAPSGTLVDANATTTITPSNTSMDWNIATFPGAFNLTASTKYWIKCTVGDQSLNNRYEWERDTSSGYAGGGQSISVSGGAFGAESATTDMLFRVYSPDPSGGFYYMSS